VCAHAPYWLLWYVRLCRIFPHYLTDGPIFGKKKEPLLNTKCVFRFSLQLLSETFLIVSIIERDIIKIIYLFHEKYRHSCRILTKLGFWQQIFEKYPNIKLHENLYSGNRVVPCGMMDRRTDMMKLTVTFGRFAKAPKALHPANTVVKCIVFIEEQSATFALYNINWLVFITEMKTF